MSPFVPACIDAGLNRPAKGFMLLHKVKRVGADSERLAKYRRLFCPPSFTGATDAHGGNCGKSQLCSRLTPPSTPGPNDPDATNTIALVSLLLAFFFFLLLLPSDVSVLFF